MTLQRQPQLDPVSPHHQNRRERFILIRHMERAPEPGTAERRRHGGTGLRRRVALLAQVRQHHCQKTRVVELNQELGRGAVRQVPG